MSGKIKREFLGGGVLRLNFYDAFPIEGDDALIDVLKLYVESLSGMKCEIHNVKWSSMIVDELIQEIQQSLYEMWEETVTIPAELMVRLTTFLNKVLDITNDGLAKYDLGYIRMENEYLNNLEYFAQTFIEEGNTLEPDVSQNYYVTEWCTTSLLDSMKTLIRSEFLPALASMSGLWKGDVSFSYTVVNDNYLVMKLIANVEKENV